MLVDLKALTHSLFRQQEAAHGQLEARTEIWVSVRAERVKGRLSDCLTLLSSLAEPEMNERILCQTSCKMISFQTNSYYFSL